MALEPRLNRTRLLLVVLLLVVSAWGLEERVLRPRLEAEAQLQQQLRTAQAALAKRPPLAVLPDPGPPVALKPHHWSSTETQYRLVRALPTDNLTLLEQQLGPVQQQAEHQERELQLKFSGSWTAFQQAWQDWERSPGMPVKVLHLQNPHPQEQNPSLQIAVTLSLLEQAPDEP